MRLKVTSFGESAEGIQLLGDPKKREPAHARIAFPGGTIEVVRATDTKNPDYWVHIHVAHPKHGMHIPGEIRSGKISDARLDTLDKHSAEVDIGEFDNPNLYHLAFRIQPNWDEKIDGNAY